MKKERNWSYKNLEITEGLKPGSTHLQYFFVVSQGGKKKCNYCVWIEDEALSTLAPSRDFDEIVSSRREDWSRWVQEKIDAKDFRNRVLKVQKRGQQEIALSEMEEKLKFE